MLLFTTHALKRMRERKITRAEVTATVKKSEAIQPADKSDMFKFMYADMPQQLKDEMDEVK